MLAKFIERPREDSLTAAVVGHLLHLPSEDFWQILREACPSPNFPENPGEPIRVHAWPSWNVSGFIEGHDRVIPDVMIEFEPFDLIIEAKRWDQEMQNPEQWKNELIGYAVEHGAKKRKVIMLALGGIHSPQDEEVKHERRSNDSHGTQAHEFVCPVHMCRWSSVLLACRRLKRSMEQATNRDSQTRAAERVLNDLIAMFIQHQIEPVWWFADFDFRPNLLTGRADADREFFRSASQRFRQIA